MMKISNIVQTLVALDFPSRATLLPAAQISFVLLSGCSNAHRDADAGGNTEDAGLEVHELDVRDDGPTAGLPARPGACLEVLRGIRAEDGSEQLSVREFEWTDDGDPVAEFGEAETGLLFVSTVWLTTADPEIESRVIDLNADRIWDEKLTREYSAGLLLREQRATMADVIFESNEWAYDGCGNTTAHVRRTTATGLVREEYWAHSYGSACTLETTRADLDGVDGFELTIEHRVDDFDNVVTSSAYEAGRLIYTIEYV